MNETEYPNYVVTRTGHTTVPTVKVSSTPGQITYTSVDLPYVITLSDVKHFAAAVRLLLNDPGNDGNLAIVLNRLTSIERAVGYTDNLVQQPTPVYYATYTDSKDTIQDDSSRNPHIK